MKENNEQLSAIFDNEIIDDQLLSELMANEKQQEQFSRYQLIGDVMRGDAADQSLNIDVSQSIMAEISQVQVVPQVTQLDTSVNKDKTQQNKNSNVISFVKRFGQYAIAASVAGVVVLTNLVTSQPGVENNNSGIEVLNTVPFGGAVTPVSLQTNQKQLKESIKQRNERLEALLKDHQLQLQTQP
ncbi:sigma-E factor negative regulatory protein [Psychromonas ossibalaenae]|uniref:sigma-E factor negative regulatory protein n=1 Tax=Psychromonas ossibalaenae TaxID=444922 RepID=UPI00037F11FC|nr:RseA family anti-sigma factor [Psychromonas ossibalaenae]